MATGFDLGQSHRYRADRDWPRVALVSPKHPVDKDQARPAAAKKILPGVATAAGRPRIGQRRQRREIAQAPGFLACGREVEHGHAVPTYAKIPSSSPWDKHLTAPTTTTQGTVRDQRYD